VGDGAKSRGAVIHIDPRRTSAVADTYVDPRGH
jgi:hypothetical protein